MQNLAQELLAGSPRALARLLTHIENQRPEARAILSELYPHTGNAHIVGVTGAPGTGKSTLVNALAKAYRTADRTVGIIAVDPTSPFSGGALLGDRIRMRDLAGDPGIFIRSMATRGSLGGLSAATGDSIRAMDAAGFSIILVETVGVGQSEIDIARQAHTTFVLTAPGLGDDVQTIKAGVLEVADILVVNKADQPGARKVVRALQEMLHLGKSSSRAEFHHGRLLQTADLPAIPNSALGWHIPILETTATQNQGIDALREALEQHYVYLKQSGLLQQREQYRLTSELETRLQNALLEQLLQQLDPKQIANTIEQITARKLNPHQAVQQLLADFLAGEIKR